MNNMYVLLFNRRLAFNMAEWRRRIQYRRRRFQIKA